MSRLKVIGFVIALFGASMNEAVADTVVGTTQDGCKASEIVSFNGKQGKVTVKANQQASVDLPEPVRELTWFCAGNQEASSNDEPYDHVKLQRAADGKLSWTFVRLSPPPAPPGTVVKVSRVGDSDDACAAQNLVSIAGTSGVVNVKANEAVIADLPKAVTELAWNCGDSKERVANDVPFDRVQISRITSGSIGWVFYLKVAAADPAEVCSKVHAFGRLVYRDERGAIQPVGRAQVKLMDQDFGVTDQEMAHGVTDADGKFDLHGSEGDSNCIGAGCKRPDPYVEFILEEDQRVDIRDPFGNSARRHTQVHPDYCGELNVHQVVWNNTKSAFGVFATEPALYSRAQNAYSTFQRLTGEAHIPGNEGLLGVEYPTALIANTPYTTWDTIHWPGAYGFIDSTSGLDNFDALYHEFGHRLRHAADGDTNHFNHDMFRYVYGRSHTFDLSSNEGFAFNEGWAEYHRTLFAPDDYFVSTVAGWSGPKGPKVEGDVAHQLYQLAQNCGGFPKLWATMKDAGPNAFHSIEEYRAEFMARNPTCQDAAPSSSAASAGGSAPESAHLPASKVDEQATAESVDIKLAPAERSERQNRLAALAQVATPARLHSPVGFAEDSRIVVEGLADREREHDEALQSRVVAAYAKALDQLALPLSSLADGSYDAARHTAISDLQKEVVAAKLQQVQDTRRDLATERAKVSDPQLAAYLDSVSAGFARAEANLTSSAGNNELPESFWPVVDESP